MFWSLSIFTGHGNLHKSSVTTSKVTYFILPAHTGTGVSHSQTQEALRREVLGKKNAGEWIGRVEISKGKIPGSRRSMHGYILTSDLLHAFKGEPLSSGCSHRRDFNFCVRSSPL